jgi:hypothetical protein
MLAGMKIPVQFGGMNRAPHFGHRQEQFAVFSIAASHFGQRGIFSSILSPPVSYCLYLPF